MGGGSAGVVSEGSEGVGVFMRFTSKKDLEAFHASKQKHAMADKYILPYTTVLLTDIDFFFSLIYSKCGFELVSIFLSPEVVFVFVRFFL